MRDKLEATPYTVRPYQKVRT